MPLSMPNVSPITLKKLPLAKYRRATKICVYGKSAWLQAVGFMMSSSRKFTMNVIK